MTQQSGARISDWLLGSARKNPEGLLLLAAGAVLLMRKSSSSPGQPDHAVSRSDGPPHGPADLHETRIGLARGQPVTGAPGRP